MKKGIGLILTVALIMAIAVVMVACNTGSSNKPSNDTSSDTSTTIAVDYSASAIAQNIETLSSAGLKVRYEITEGGVTHTYNLPCKAASTILATATTKAIWTCPTRPSAV